VLAGSSPNSDHTRDAVKDKGRIFADGAKRDVQAPYGDFTGKALRAKKEGGRKLAERFISRESKGRLT